MASSLSQSAHGDNAGHGVIAAPRQRGTCTPGRCFKAVDPVSEGKATFIAIDAQPNHQVVHLFRLGKAPIRRLPSRGNTPPCATFDHFFLDSSCVGTRRVTLKALTYSPLPFASSRKLPVFT